jgi:CheY-like chemotaxis protein
MDCEMPVLDGYECTREIRRREESRGIHTPVLALSAHVTPEHNDLCFSSGMDEVLAKPVTLAALRSACLQWMKNS